MLLLCVLTAAATGPRDLVDSAEVLDTAEAAILAEVEGLLADHIRLVSLGDPHGKSRLRRRAAAETLLDFVRYFPYSEHAPDTLYSAGVAFDQLGDTAQARALFTDFVTKYPDDERSYPLMFRIAAEHEQAMELEKAVWYFAQIARQRDYVDAPYAQYNLAFLSGVMGDHRRAAEGFERYAQTHPEMADARAVLAMAGPHWEAVGEAEAEAFYHRLLRGSLSHDVPPLDAHYRLALLQTESRAKERAWNQLGALLQTVPEGPERSRYAALVMIQDLEERMVEWSTIRYPGSPEALLTLLDREAPYMLAEQLMLSSQLVATGDATGVIAGLYFSGAGHIVYADMLEGAPTLLTGDGALIMARWAASAEALEMKGMAMLEASQRAAQTSGVYAVWVDHGATMLAALDVGFKRIRSLSTPRDLDWDDPHLALSRQHRESGDLLAARDALLLKLHSTPDADADPRLHTALADLYSLQDRHTQARAALERAVEIDPTFVPALHRLAQLDLRCYRLEAAITLLTSAAQQAPDDSRIAADLVLAEEHLARTTRLQALP